MKREYFPTEQPSTLDVTVWWFRPSHKGQNVSYWWFTSAPEQGRTTFRVIYTRFGKEKVRVDLVYPLGPLPSQMSPLTRRALQRALNQVVQAALPDLKVARWSHTCIDLEFVAKDKEEA